MFKIDPKTLTGTLKSLAEKAASAGGDKNLVDTDSEISVFKNSAQLMLKTGIAKDYTQDDIDKIFGFEKSKITKTVVEKDTNVQEVTQQNNGPKVTKTKNPDGTTTTSIDLDGDGNVDKELIRDANGKQKDVIEYSYGEREMEDGKRASLKVAEHELWENDKCIGKKTVKYVNGKEAEREEMIYNDNGICKFMRYEDGKLKERTETSYYKDSEIIGDGPDSEGDNMSFEKETREYDENNELVKTIEYTYIKDNEGNISAKVVKETDVKTGEVRTTTYDKDNPEVLTITGVDIGH